MKQRFGFMWLIARRELVDQLRDWRILAPMAALILFFPFLMNFFTQVAVDFINKYGANLVAERFGPFMLMVAGFFPATVSLVVALEAFVGEKERGSMEPLLSSPITDVEIYMGKLLAGSIVPLFAGYLSIFLYLFLLAYRGGHLPDTGLIIQITVLNSVQTVLMVSAAIVISTQSTSVRAANLLASFIILPVGILIQAESYLIFWGTNNVLWIAVIGLSILAGLLIRLGLSHFQREKLLGREIDVLNLQWLSMTFWTGFSGSRTLPATLRYFLRNRKTTISPESTPVHLKQALSDDYIGIIHWYRVEIVKTLKKTGPAIAISSFIGIASIVGAFLYVNYRLAETQVDMKVLREAALELGVISDQQMSGSSGNVDMLKDLVSTPALFVHNTRSALIISVLGFFSFGLLGYMLYMFNMAVIGGLMSILGLLNISPLLVFLAGILPHGIFELPAITLAVSTMLYATVRLVTPEESQTIGEVFIGSIADWMKIFVGVCLPLFLLAALVEANITPLILIGMLGHAGILPGG